MNRLGGWPSAFTPGLHGEDAGGRMLAADTAASAIALADWFAGEQLRILARGRHAARRAKRDEVLALLADNPKGITARDVHRARIVDSADEARALLAQMEADGELTARIPSQKPADTSRGLSPRRECELTTGRDTRDTRDRRGRVSRL